MYRFRVHLGAAFIVCAAFVAASAQAVPPAEAFGRLPAFGDAQVSPDGRHLATLQSLEGKQVATIYKVGASAGTLPAIFKPEDGKVRGIKWANNGRLLIWMSITYAPPREKYRRTFEFERILSIKSDLSESEFLFQGSEFKNVVGAGYIISWLPGDPDHILMAQLDAQKYDRGGRRFMSRLRDKAFRGVSVFKVNVNTGREKKIETGENNTRDWIADPRGMVRIRVDKDDETAVSARNEAGERFSEIARYDEEDWRSAMTFWGFGKTPDKVYVTARKDTDRRGVYLYELTSAKIMSKVFLHDRFDAGRMIIDDYTGRIVGTQYTDHLPETAYFDRALSETEKKLEKVFKGQSVSIVSMSKDRNVMSVLVAAPGNPGRYYLYEANARRVSPIAARYPELKPEDLGPVKPFNYQARDGLTIPAYLTLPPGKTAANLQLVVLPHGGPEFRDDQTFDWWAQFYASRGYAVFQPNYRGSSGYGAKYVKAGHGEFGRKMQDDLTDGVKHLIAEGIADPKRVCIVGASYGGYAALAGAAITPEIYACAVSVAGISDLNLMMSMEIRQSGQQSDSYSVKYWERWLGDRISDEDRMRAASPVNHAARVRAPILLIHGKDDTVVRFLQSEKMAGALKKAGKPYKMIELEEEDHWLSQADSRIRILKETEAFLKEHIGG